MVRLVLASVVRNLFKTFQWLLVVLQIKIHEVLHAALCPSFRLISHQTPLCKSQGTRLLSLSLILARLPPAMGSLHLLFPTSEVLFPLFVA